MIYQVDRQQRHLHHQMNKVYELLNYHRAEFVKDSVSVIQLNDIPDYLIRIHILANGDVIVTLLPINTKWPWITPAVFRPELVPEELMAQGLTVSNKSYNVPLISFNIESFSCLIYS